MHVPYQPYTMRKLWIVIMLSIVLVACRKEHGNPGPKPPTNSSDTILLAVDQSQQGYPISPSFEGLSFETQILTKNPEYLNVNNSVLIQMIKNLGPGILRIGGDTSDETDWTGAPRDPSTPATMLTTSDIDRLSAFSRASGWPVLFGLNLGSNHLDACTNEATYVYNSLGSNLSSLQIGNEPDIYHMFGLRGTSYNAVDYSEEWETYFSAIKKNLPQVTFAGPDVANNNAGWVEVFSSNESSKVTMLDQHYYITGPASDPSINYQNLLTSSTDVLAAHLQGIKVESITNNLPYRITECNSIYGGGKVGASDVFAASLWALDFMWTVAENYGQGINFHGGKLVYSPITMSDNVVTAKPVYYGMLAFKYGNTGGTLAPVSVVNSEYNFSAHASLNSDNTYSITLINKDEKANIPVTIQLSNKAASTIQIARLTAPSVTSADNITFAGSSVSADGTFKPGPLEQVTVNNKTFTVIVAAGSAAIVTVH